MAKYTEIPAADVVKRFAKQDITVQTATPAKFKVKDADGKDTGKERDGFKVKDEALAAEHVLSAVKGEGKVVIVTIDGRKYEAAAGAAAA
jgi:hypothetical protein